MSPTKSKPATSARQRCCPFCGESRPRRVVRAFRDDAPPFALRCRSCGNGFVEEPRGKR